MTLARRGHKEAVPRALNVFFEKVRSDEENIRESGMAGVPHGNLQKRVLVLLSNSARVSGVPQPAVSEKREEHFHALTRWWQAHENKLTMCDPWLPILEKQKVD